MKTIRLLHGGQAKEIGLGSGSAAVDGRSVSIEIPSAAPGRGPREVLVDGRRFRVETARAGGFGRVNVDLIYGIPGQTMDTWARSLERAIESHSLR